MDIVDVISEANHEDLIYFLLTAYVEAVWHERAQNSIPGWVQALPLNGRSDVRARFVALADSTSCGRAALEPDARDRLSEALAVFGSAVLRLDALGGDGHARAEANGSAMMGSEF